MKEEISDNEFDRLFKEKSQNFDYEFEEDAWNLMEKKLRRRDRIIYIQRFGMAALVLLFLGAGLYLFNLKNESTEMKFAVKPQRRDSSILAGDNDKTGNAEKHGFEGVKKTTSPQPLAKSESLKIPYQENTGAILPHGRAVSFAKNASQRKLKSSSNKNVPSHKLLSLSADDKHSLPIQNTGFSAENETISAGAISDSLAYLASVPLHNDSHTDSTSSITLSETLTGRLVSLAVIHPKPRFSFTFAAGPDYSSIESLKGSQGNLNVGLLLSLSYKKFTLSTGAKYGIKKYSAGGFDYAMSNPSRAEFISTINAACNVLEIPAQLSFTAFKFNKQQIDITGGLSSYLMLKEDYQFSYKPETGWKDYYLQKTNANRSYFGVLSFSAAYKFKPIKQHILVGIEPYAKLPLGGVGEGKVRLKSSGVALTMTYEIIRRN